MAYRQWEFEMLAEYVAALLPRARVVTNVRLGPVAVETRDPGLTAAERALLGAPFRRWCDAIAVEPDRLLVLEAAMMPQPGDISLLELYLELVPHTPELEEWRELPRRGRLVWAVDDAYSRSVAVKHGLEVVIFKPSHLGEWLQVVRERERGAGRKTRPVRDALAVEGKR